MSSCRVYYVLMTLTQEILILLPLLLFSISVHETMHAVASFWLGDDTAAEGGRISLNPLRHIDPYLTVILPLFTLALFGQILAIAKPVQVYFNRLKWDEFGGAIVGAVGPLSNLVIALTAAGLFHLLNPSYGSLLFYVLSIATELNIVLFVINLIPWPPLDGSRVLYAFAPRPLQELMMAIESSGVLTLVLFFLIFYSFIGQGIWNLVTTITRGLGVPLPML